MSWQREEEIWSLQLTHTHAQAIKYDIDLQIFGLFNDIPWHGEVLNILNGFDFIFPSK